MAGARVDRHVPVMRVATWAIALAVGCGGSTSGPVSTLEDASVPIPDPSDAGSRPSCMPLLATNYDQTCATDDDCVPVGNGDPCTGLQQYLCSFGGAINKGAASAYHADLEADIEKLAPPPFDCPYIVAPEPVPCCVAAQCTLCPPP